MIRDYSCELVHGLLQTADYARAVTLADSTLSPQVIERRVAFRPGRQRAFFNRPTPGRLDAVLTAGALELVVGSQDVMDAQLASLRAACTRDEVSVRVLPATNGVHSGMRGGFAIMDFVDPDDPQLVYLESLIGCQYVERSNHVTAFRRVFDQVRAQAVALEEYIG